MGQGKSDSFVSSHFLVMPLRLYIFLWEPVISQRFCCVMLYYSLLSNPFFKHRKCRRAQWTPFNHYLASVVNEHNLTWFAVCLCFLCPQTSTQISLSTYFPLWVHLFFFYLVSVYMNRLSLYILVTDLSITSFKPISPFPLVFLTVFVSEVPMSGA